jgi:16S rRNA (uracil1498-N3)-methyltransferase
MSERFYINWPLAPGPVELTGAEAHHLATVRRFRVGDAVCLFNGDGREYAARVVHVERRRIALEVTGVASPERELPFALEVAAPLPKGDRGQFLVEKLTELGVARFVPLTTERSVVHPREGKLERLERWVIEASKQCGRNVLMQIAPVEAWASYCRRADSRALRFLAHPGELAIAKAHHELVCLAVGPEGGLTDEEVALARAAGWQTVGLGPRTLRIETAALLLAARFTVSA